MTPWNHLVEYERRRLNQIIRDLRCGYVNAEDMDRLHLFVSEALNVKQRAGAADQWRGEPVHDYGTQL